MIFFNARRKVRPEHQHVGGREEEDEESGDKARYQIVGEDDADLKLGLINISSPIARALIGKEAGDTAVVQAPGGTRSYEIVDVRYI